MAKINKRFVDTADARARDYLIWDDELPGFGLRVFASGTRSYVIHTLDTALIMAADTISGYFQGLLDGVTFKQTAYALDRGSRKAALGRFLQEAAGEDHAKAEAKAQFAG